MLTVEEQVEIKILARQGMSIREISRQLQVSRNTRQTSVVGVRGHLGVVPGQLRGVCHR
ncbi:helix-turn-helix domain-containing protein [Xanthomonas axonopodis pv. khayae]